MAITYNYTIDSAITIKNDSASGLSDIIDTLCFTITATDENGRSESLSSRTGILNIQVVGTNDDGEDINAIDIDSENFTPIEELTQEQMKTWLLEILTTEDENGNPHNGMEKMLAKRFEPTEENYGEVVFN